MSDESRENVTDETEAGEDEMPEDVGQPEATTTVDQPVAEDEVSAEAELESDAAQPEPAAAEASAGGDEEASEAEPAEEMPAAEAPAAAPVPKKARKRLPRAERRQRAKPKREKSAQRKPITRLPKPEHPRGRRQERLGTVVSSAADKTIVVRVDVVKLHPTYKKVIRRSTKLHAHDEQNQAKVGDVVRIVETRPLSRMKRWRLQEIVEEAK